jgi:hypothetical protein
MLIGRPMQKDLRTRTNTPTVTAIKIYFMTLNVLKNCAKTAAFDGTTARSWLLIKNSRVYLQLNC